MIYLAVVRRILLISKGIAKGGLHVFDTSSDGFRELTDELFSNRSQLTNFDDFATADFDGDLQQDLYITRDGLIFNTIIQDTPNFLRGNFTRGQERTVRIKTEGSITFHFPQSYTIDDGGSHLQTIFLDEIFIGEKGYHPDESSYVNAFDHPETAELFSTENHLEVDSLSFTLTPENIDNIGLIEHSSDQRGVFIGYEPDTQEWLLSWTGVGVNPQRQSELAFYVQTEQEVLTLEGENFDIDKSPLPDRIFLNQGDSLSEQSNSAGINVTQFPGSSVTTGDFDNDMDLDLYVVSGGGISNPPNVLYDNKGDGFFELVQEAGGATGSALGVGESVTIADYNLDGFLDFFVTNGTRPAEHSLNGPHQLFQGIDNGNHWLQIDLEGVVSNRDAIGAKVFVTAGGITQVLEQSGGVHKWSQDFKRLHFGLGSNTNVEEIEIHWPSGSIQRIENVQADQIIHVLEDDSSSVPTQWFEDATDASLISSFEGSEGRTYGSAWGDANSDDLPDLWVNNHDNNTGILYINNGNSTFSDGTFDFFQSQELTGDFHGAAWADFDNDGDQDLLQLAGNSGESVENFSNSLFVNDNGQLTDQANAFGIQYHLSKGQTPIWLDIDNDGLLDFVMTANARPDQQSPPTVFRQTANGFENIGKLIGFDVQSSQFGTLSDVSGDGTLDLIIDGASNTSIYNILSFPASNTSELLLSGHLLPGEDIVVGDFNGDLHPDAYITRDGSGLQGVSQTDDGRINLVVSAKGTQKGITFQSSGEITIDLRPLTFATNDIFIGSSGISPEAETFTLSPDDTNFHGIPTYTSGVDAGVYIGYDAATSEWQIFVSNPPSQSTTLSVIIDSSESIANLQATGFNQEPQIRPDQFFIGSAEGFIESTAESGLDASLIGGKSVVTADFDNDMDLDLYVLSRNAVSNSPNILYENLGDGTFSLVEDAGGAPGSTLGVGDSVTAADYDLDGFIDLFVTNGASPPVQPSLDGPHQLFRNIGNGNHWLQIDLEGVISNRDGIGASVYIKAGGVTQLREQSNGIHRFSQNSKRLHFGLADNETIDEIEIHWPSGIVQRLTDIDVDQVIRIQEGDENIASGTEAADRFVGTAANETYLGQGGNDSLLGRGGDDLLRGNEGNDTLLGQFGDDILQGGAGNDRFIGGQGLDRLTGGSGQDTFVFQDPTEAGDVITDFASGEDILQIKAVRFGAGLREGALPESRFVLGSEAQENGDRFLYDQLTGQLFFDADGSESSEKVLLATFNNLPNLTAQDIQILGNAPNTNPVVGADTATTQRDTAINIDVLSNDFDADGDLLSLSITSHPSNGSVAINDQGTSEDLTDDSVVYTPNSGFTGEDQFSYSVDDGQGGIATGTVEVSVSSSLPSSPLFQEVTQPSGIDRVGQSWGVFWGDFDFDGFADIWMPDHFDAGTLYHNQGDGTFTEATSDVFSLEQLVEDTHAAVWADFDNDGDQDLLQTVGAQAGAGSGPTQLFVNDNGRLDDRGEASGVDYPLGRGRSALWMDIDNNGLLDIVTAVRTRPDQSAPPTIFLQTSDGFEDAGTDLGFSPQNRQSEPYAMFSDLDRDGSPELIYKDGSPPFAIYGTATVPLTDKTNLLSSLPNSAYGMNSDIVIADFDGDLRPDIYFGQNGIESDAGQQSDTIVKMAVVSRVNESIEKGISFKTSGDIRFTLGPQPFGRQRMFIGASGTNPNSGKAFTLSSDDSAVVGMPSYTPGTDRGVFIGFDNASQEWEVIVLGPTAGIFAAHIESTETISELASINLETNRQARPDILLRNAEDEFEDISTLSGLNEIKNASNSVVAGDFDNDMDVDVYVLASGPSTNLPNLYYENQGDGTFVAVENGNGAAGTSLGVGDAAAAADYDNDGFLDLVMTNGKWVPPGGEDSPADIAPVQLFKNQGNSNNWLQIYLEGTVSNRDGLGAQVYVTAGGVTQLREQTGGVHNRAQDFSRLHFGLADNEIIEKVEIRWSSGLIQEVTSLAANQVINIVEGGITGTDANERLSGTADAETISGLGGKDKIVAGGGNDYLIGGDGNDFLVGNSGNDRIEGGLGNDLLIGGQGDDILTGDAGRDTFRIQSPTEALNTITDFASAEDVIEVKQFKFLAGLTKGVLAATQFELGIGATSSDTRFIYDQSAGNLLFDANGSASGGQILIATLSNQSTLTNTDIVVI